ncbi:MAG: hypothetical protein ACHQLA_03040 [Ignavibacteriales bacterium]
MRSGCIKKSFFGCSAIFFIFFLTTFLLIFFSEFADLDFSFQQTEQSEYKIEFDSLSNEKIINSSFSWKFVDNNLKKRKFDLSFKILEKDVKAAMNHIDKIAAMSFRDLGLQSRYPDPVAEARIVWAELYRRIYNYSSPQIKTVFEGFNKIFKEENFDSRDKIYFVITFVQNITYERPGGVLDLFPPLGTLAYRYGDCDSKALLLYVIFEKMGVDCAMLWSYKYKHAMLGINFNGRGDYLKANGKKYFFLETTYPQWNIGDLPPEFNNTKFWFIEEIDSDRIQNSIIDYEGNEIEERDSKKETKPFPSKPD